LMGYHTSNEKSKKNLSIAYFKNNKLVDFKAKKY